MVGSPCSPRTLKSLLQHHSSKASILRCSVFFIVQLSHPYMATGKTIALTRRTFVGKVMSLLLNMLSRLVITFLPRSECLLISWLQSPSAVVLEPPKIKSWRRQWQPTPVLLPGKSHGWKSLVGFSPWGRDWATSLSLFTYMWNLKKNTNGFIYNTNSQNKHMVTKGKRGEG